MCYIYTTYTYIKFKNTFLKNVDKIKKLYYIYNILYLCNHGKNHGRVDLSMKNKNKVAV